MLLRGFSLEGQQLVRVDDVEVGVATLEGQAEVMLVALSDLVVLANLNIDGGPTPKFV